jgi:Plasmid pRiA4b ORF-3-like protein
MPLVGNWPIKLENNQPKNQINMAKLAKQVIQLKITIKNSKPPIWRRVLVENTYTFGDLHEVIQDAMGWDNCHLYMFQMDGFFISDEDEKQPDEEIIGHYLSEVKQKFTYTYDFGDDWHHTIVVEDFLPYDEAQVYPVCTAGKLNCPPEDCGGIYGFYQLMETIKDKNHPEHQDMIAWLGEDYDPTRFSKIEVNARLC